MHVYLIHGPDEVAVQTERLRLIDRLLPAEQRDENLTEFTPPGNRPLLLSRLLPDLLSELGTVSFFPGARRVAVVQNLSDFWSTPKESASAPARKGAAKPLGSSERLIKYFEDDFESTDNAVIFTVNEDPDKRVSVDGRKKIVQWIKAHGKLISFDKQRPAAWILGDAILDRNLNQALALFRLAYRKKSTDQALAVLSSIERQVRFLLQAKVAGSAMGHHPETFIAEELLPSDAKSNLMKAHPFVRKKTMAAARLFKVGELTQAVEDLYTIRRHLFPVAGDVYVPDAGLLMENLIIRLCSGVT